MIFIFKRLIDKMLIGEKMKLTESQLRRLIREEISKNVLLEYEQLLVRKGNSTYLVDDDGNEEYYDDYPEDHYLYKDGDSVPYVPRSRGAYGEGGYDRRGFGSGRLGYYGGRSGRRR